MKRNIVLSVVLAVLLFASCKNEDITMQRKMNVNFIVDPSEVISGFDHEIEGDEFWSLSSDYRLQIHLLVYDDMGQLADSTIDYLSDYQNTKKMQLKLWVGEYTAVAITDVVKYDDDATKYWNITETNSLSSLKISVSDAGNSVSDGKYKILGISNHSFNVNVREELIDDTIQVDTIQVKPAGALVHVKASNIHYFDSDSVVSYQLCTNKSADCCTFNGDGNFVVEPKENHTGQLGQFKPQGLSKEHQYYDFVLPLGQTVLRWYGTINEDNWLQEGEEMTADIRRGDEYLVCFKLGSGDETIAQIFPVHGGKVSE